MDKEETHFTDFACICGEGLDKDAYYQELIDLASDEEAGFTYDPEETDRFFGGLLEHFIWSLNDLGILIDSLASDQWVAVSSSYTKNWGKEDEVKHTAWIQGDTFLLAMAATYKYWKEKIKEIEER